MVNRTYSLLLLSFLLVGLGALGPVGRFDGLGGGGVLGVLGLGRGCLALVGGSDYVLLKVWSVNDQSQACVQV